MSIGIAVGTAEVLNIGRAVGTAEVLNIGRAVGTAEVLGKKEIVPVSLYSPQVSHRLLWDRTGPCASRDRGTA